MSAPNAFQTAIETELLGTAEPGLQARSTSDVTETLTCVGDAHEWHVDIGKSPLENEMGEKGLSCSDGFDYEPIFGKEAQQCVFLTTDGFANK